MLLRALFGEISRATMQQMGNRRGRPRACLELLLSFQRSKPEAFLDNVEIAVFMEQGKVVFDAYCGYDAVNGFPYSLAIFPALSVDFCRLKIGFNTLRFVNWKFEKIILHSFEIFIRFYSLKDLRKNYFSN